MGEWHQPARQYPDNGVEHWGYTLNVSSPTGYTNQIGNVSLYNFDILSRKTNEVVAGVTTNSFTYNGAGDRLTLTDGKGQTTSWLYDQNGNVTNKLDANNALLFVYQYDPDNRLTNRWSAAKGNTVYSYDAAGNLKTINYQHSPAINLAYDVLNRLTNMVTAGTFTNSYTYDSVGQLLSEDGPWANDTVSYTYQNRLRTTLSLSQPSGSWSQSYGYDVTRRMTNVTSQAGGFGYAYPSANFQLPSAVSLPNGAWITNTFDGNARLLSTILKNSGGTVLDSESYAYNQASQRTAETNTAGDFRNYTYDNEGELKTAIGKEAGGTTNRLQEQNGYAYDAAGNLNYRTNNALVQDFSVNNLNELSTVTRSGTLTVAGTTTSPATNVAVNSLAANLYADATFALGGFSLVDGTNTFTAVAKDSYGRVDTNTSICYLLATNFYAYDLNGNMLTNGTEVMVWNDENELVTNFVAGSWKSDFVYDGSLRRRIEKDYSWSGSSWVQTNEIHFVYDGNVIIQQRDANNMPTLTLTRGNDLSGSLQGAGGIGGLLAMTENSGTSSYYHADGNGNVTMLINAYQIPVAKAEYGPYGNFLSLSGPKTGVNFYWFSSKPIHWQSGKYDYLLRWYIPDLDRWPNRDPIQEQGGINLYAYVNNSPISLYDPFGLDAGWGGAIGNGLSWGMGHNGDTAYGPGSAYSQQMSQSTVAAYVRTKFLSKNAGKLCKDWVGIWDVVGHFGLSGLFNNWSNGTAEFVGSARGDVNIVRVNCSGASGTVTADFKLTNTTSLTSALYGLWPNWANVTIPGTPFSNWTQTYDWNETFNCKCCNPN